MIPDLLFSAALPWILYGLALASFSLARWVLSRMRKDR